jgi:hypothetical protein
MVCRLLPLIAGFIVNHKAVELLMITAIIKTAPVSSSGRWWETAYYWFYDGSHQFFNITNTRLNTQQIVTPPETQATPKA